MHHPGSGVHTCLLRPAAMQGGTMSIHRRRHESPPIFISATSNPKSPTVPATPPFLQVTIITGDEKILISIPCPFYEATTMTQSSLNRAPGIRSRAPASAHKPQRQDHDGLQPAAPMPIEGTTGATGTTGTLGGGEGTMLAPHRARVGGPLLAFPPLPPGLLLELVEASSACIGAPSACGRGQRRSTASTPGRPR